MADRLSIVNPFPKKVRGPELLHQLVPDEVRNGTAAIEHLSSNQTIESISYRQLHRRANALARVLRSTWERVASTPKPAHFIVPIFIPQCPDLYISELATLKAGAAFCPVSLDVPEERLRFILHDVDAKVLLTTSQRRSSLPNLEGITVVSVDAVDSEHFGVDLQDDIAPSEPAYIMYTSGSTGQPKGVVVSHSAATQSLLAHDRHIPTFSRFLQFASPTFDVSVFEIFFPLFRGCTVISGDRRRLLNDLPSFITRMSVDAAELTPSVASSLLHGRSSVPTLKTLLTIGEMLKRDVVEDFGGTVDDDGVLHGMYGPTEASIHCTVQTSFLKTMSISNIGVPFDTVSAFVIEPSSSEDPSQEPIHILPVGEEGELAVGGHQLAAGYLKRPEQTAASFIHHPEYGILYRTGDRARLTASGTLECLGRIASGQVKLRGQRVELGEIEYAASNTLGVRSVVSDIINGNVVVFCLANVHVHESQVWTSCRKWLPAFMVPADIVLLSTLPYLSSGKVDRKALQALYLEQKSPTPATNGEATPTNNHVVDILSRVLQHPVDDQTQLSAIGLDSLSSIRIASEFRRAGLPQLNANVILESGNVRDIELHLKQVHSGSGSIANETSAAEVSSTLRNAVSNHRLLSGRLAQIDDIFAATPVQSAMLSETARNGQTYCNWVEFRMIDHQIDIVHKSLTTLAAQHALLRSGFVHVNEAKAPHAVIVWKDLPPNQIFVSDHFDYNFKVESEVDLLHPCAIQLSESRGETKMLLKIHHALYDQWSMDVFRSDLEALLLGREISPYQSFKSVSMFYQENHLLARSEPTLGFWRDILRDFVPTLLPQMNDSRQTRRLQRTSWRRLAQDLTAIRRKARKLGCTAPTIFQAAMAYMLGQYTGNTDVTFGVVFSGRHLPLPELESVFGPCLATLPLRVDFEATRSCLDLLRLIQCRTRDLQKYALAPLADIKGALDCAPGVQLFDTIFVWQETSLPLEDNPQYVKEVGSSDNHEYNLVLEFEPRRDELWLRVTYQQALIPEHQIEALVDQVRLVADSIVKDPAGPVSSLVGCLPRDLLSISNPSPSPYAMGHSLLSSIEDHALRNPHSLALVFAQSLSSDDAKTETLTYVDFNMRSNRMARFLQSHNVQPGDLVCICMQKSVDMYVCILAAVKAAAGYLPLTPETPVARLKSILDQSDVKVCLCDDQTISKFATLQVTEAINADTLDVLHLNSGNLAIRPSESYIAYTVFTSGSTGEPKGVAVTHGNLLGNLQALLELYQVRPGDRLLQACSQAFDVSVFEIFFAFYTGICLCSATKEVLFDDLEAGIRSLHISHLSLTPTVAALVDPSSVPDVRFLVTAGEAITDLVHRRWAGQGLHQGYGPSETTNICTVNMNVSRNDLLANIGHPLRNTSAFVISPKSVFDLLPSGSIGEFAFGGEQVFRGYVGMNTLNAEKIINHPEFGRIYKSGDIGRILPNGTLLISGRVDDQVKIRGNRVELAEITSILLDDPEVHDCATILTGSEAESRGVAAFIVPARHSSGDIAETFLDVAEEGHFAHLFDRLEECLPSYMIPDIILPVNTLPLTSQGKLDKRRLGRLLSRVSCEARASFTRDRGVVDNSRDWTAGESKVVEALKDTLQISSAGLTRHGSLLSFGVNSLNAIAFTKALKSRTDTPISVSTVLRSPTIAQLARILGENEGADLASVEHEVFQLLPAEVTEEVRALCASFEDNIECVLPCTPLQEAMLSSSITRTLSTYCNTLTLNIVGDLPTVKQCWNNMIKRHAILRTRFVRTEHVTHPYVQVVLKDMPLPWRERSLNHFNSTALQEDNVGDSASSTVDESQPFHIGVQTWVTGTKLQLHMHHAIYDGISMSRLLHEVEVAYHGGTLHQPRSFIPFLLEMQKSNAQDAIDFWSAQMKGYRAEYTSLSQSELAEEVVLQKNLSFSRQELELYCRKHAISQVAFFQAALIKVLACCQRAEDICCGNVVSGRTVPVDGVEMLVAPCFNTVPIRAKLTGTRSNSALIQLLNKKNTDILRYQLTPLRRIQRLSSSPSRPLFYSLLILQPDHHILDCTVWNLEAEAGDMGLPLVFEIQPNTECYGLVLHFLQPTFSRTIARELSDAFKAALLSCLKYPHGGIDDFDAFDSRRIAGILTSEPAFDEGSYMLDDRSNDRWTASEEAIHRVFCQLAKVSESIVKKDTSLYQLGLDSLNAPQVASRLRSLGFTVDAADVMETLTPASLAALVDRRSFLDVSLDVEFNLEAFETKHQGPILQPLKLDNTSVEAIRPCTSVQCGMLAQSLITSGKLYINHITYAVPVQITTVDIQAAWSLVRARHQILRTGFHHVYEARIPFAMLIFRSFATAMPFVEAKADKELTDIEKDASQAIVENIQSRPWLVSMRYSQDRATMTLSLHHALYDAESLSVIVSDFGKALSFSKLPPSTNIDPLLRWTLTAEMNHDELTERYWQERLCNASISKFPDLNRTVIRDGVLKSECYTCSLSLSSLESFCRVNSATIQALGQTAWALLLAAYTSDEKVTFGTIFSGHSTSEARGVPFPSITIIPVPCNTSCLPLEVVHNMVEFNASSQRHRFAPLSNLQRLAGNASYALFDTVFVYQKLSSESALFDWPTIRETAGVDYVASLEFEAQSNADMLIRLSYNTAHIPSQQAFLIVQQYDYILTQLVSGQGRPILASEPIWARIAPVDPIIPSKVHLLHGFLEQTAYSHPDRPAFEFVHSTGINKAVSQIWTYKQLDEVSNQVAHLVQRSGVPTNSIIAVCMDKCPEASFAFIGILKAGCSFLTIDPELPENRLKFILEDSNARVLFGDQKKPPRAILDSVKYVKLEESILTNLPTSRVTQSFPSVDSTCYCLYTSGTTGAPKGCEISHENAVQAMLAFQRLFAGRWTESSRWLQFASYWFDVSILEQFWSWSVGITVVGAPRDLVLEDLPGFLHRQNITHIDLTPSLARLLQPSDVPSLWNGVFITGGEPLKQEIIDAWGPKRTVCNGYGPTEATIGVTMNTFIGADAKPSNIGCQFDNVGTYVLRPGTDEPVLRGTIGELCVSGKLVGKGYLNRPDLTATHFPFLGRLGETVYRTGDLVRMLADGSFAFVGRADSQSKLRGQRLELTEIENVLRRSSDEIHDAVSLVIKSEEGEKETLVSFLAMGAHKRAEKMRLDSSEMSHRLVQASKEACASQLPRYMVPTHIIAVNHLPLTVNNKADTKQLATLFSSASARELTTIQNAENDSRQLNESERRICEVLLKVLRTVPVDIAPKSNLFSLGLSSISAIPFSNLLKKAGFSNASIANVMRHPTVEQLSLVISTDPQRHREDDSVRQAQLRMTAFHHRHLLTASTVLSITIDEIETVVPCTPLQQGLIIESLRDDSKPHWNDFRYAIGIGTSPKLKMALQKLIYEVQVLRTRFIETDDGFAQAVLHHVQTDVSEWPVSSDDVEAFCSKLKAQWMTRNTSDLLVPVEFHIVDAATNAYLVVHIHHALYDGISYELIYQLLSQIYHSGLPQELGPSFATALPYGPLRHVASAENFWQQRLEGIYQVAIAPTIEQSSTYASMVTFRLDDRVGMEEARQQLGVSHQALIQACFEIALRKSAPLTQMYGLVSSGRSIELNGADRVMGPMFNTLPQPLSLKLDSSSSEHVRRCHTLNVEAIPFQHTPLRDIRKWLGQPNANRMFDVLFVFQYAPSSDCSRTTESLEPIVRVPRAHYSLACEVDLVDDGSLTITLLAQSTFLSQNDLEQLQETFNKALQSVLLRSEGSIEETFDIAKTEHARQPLESHARPVHINGIQEYHWTDLGNHIRTLLGQLSGLETDDIDEHSTIFALGLDSIDAVKLSSRLRAAGFSMPVSKILKAQTIPRMLQALQGSSTSPFRQQSFTKLSMTKRQLSQANLHSILPDTNDIERILSATPHQEALVAEMVRSNFREYLNHDILRLRPDTDLERLKSAWQAVVDARPILRTSFVEIPDPGIDGVFAQVVHIPTQIRFTEYECDKTDELQSICDWIREDVLAKPSSPALRLTLVTLHSERYLILSLAHAQYDGHSLALLHEDVRRAYNKQLHPRPAYDDAIEVALAAPQDHARAFWSSSLVGARTHRFPRIQEDGERSSLNRAEMYSKTSVNEARAFCQKQGVSMQVLAQLCWAITLAYYVGDLDVLFGAVLACRDSEEREQMMFPTMNTVVIRASLHGSRAQMLQHMQGVMTNLLPYQRTPLRTIQAVGTKVMAYSASDLGNALFDTFFIYQHRPTATTNDTETLYESIGGRSNVGYALAVEMEAVGEKLAIRAACEENVLHEPGVIELLNRIESVLQAIVTFPEEPTVEFKGDKVSMCGLGSVYLNNTDRTTPNPGPPPPTISDGLAQTSSSLTATIMKVLSEVSKTHMEELSLESTVESIGIDSISAIKVAALLRKESIKLSVSDIIRAKTAGGMAQIASTTASQNLSVEQPPSQTIAQVIRGYDIHAIAMKAGLALSNVEAVMPATAGQVYMVSMWQKTDDQLFYPTFSYLLKTDLSIERIKQTWAVLVDRHAILRTVFCITMHSDLPLLQVALKDAPDSFASDGEAAGKIVAGQPMVYLKASANDTGYLLELTIHHALYDAVSLPLLMHDFQSLLARSSSVRHSLKFDDFIALSVTQAAIKARKDFWTRNLQDLQLLQLPQPEVEGAQTRVEIFEPALFSGAEELEERVRKEGLSMQALLFAAYAKVYANLVDKGNDSTDARVPSDVLLGIYLSNRSHLAELDTHPSPTLNIVPLLVRTPLEKSLIDIAKQVHTDFQSITSVENSAVGLWEIYEWTGHRVDTFVNFVKLPERTEQAIAEDGSTEVVLQELDARRTRRRREVVKPREGGFEVPAELKELNTDAYLHSVDIEMITTDGKLGVGIFCPEVMVGLEQAGEALQELKSILEKFVGKAKK